MATKFLEPGGDADFTLTSAPTGFWSAVSGAALATDFVHGTHVKSIKYRPNTADEVMTAESILADAGSRMSFWIYVAALPTGNANFCLVQTAVGATVMTLRLTSAGVLQAERITQIGSDGPTLSTGQWYRISLAYTITTATVTEVRVWVNSALAITASNAVLVTGSSNFQIGNLNTDLTLDFRSSDHYIDDSSSLADTGTMWVTAKRPVANGTAVEFTTQVGVGGSGVGTGHTPQVNERPTDTANGWSILHTTKKTEEYTIQSTSAGDINISTYTIVDYMGWIYAKISSAASSPVQNIIVGGTVSAITALGITAEYRTKIAGSSTYPTGNTDIGMDSTHTGTARTTSLFECGIIVAATAPGAAAASSAYNNLSLLGVGA